MEQQDWPELKTAPSTISLATQRMSGTSARIYAGSLPPSSRETGITRSAAARWIVRPASTEPVKQTRRICGERTMDSSRGREPQWKYWRTFWGRPACRKMSWMCSAMVGVWGEGLRMTELPARRAGIKEFIKIR